MPPAARIPARSTPWPRQPWRRRRRQGRLLPSTSVDQYAATMGKWLGISHIDLLTVLPKLGNWDASQRNLGFV